jgi:hypothetical protein
MRRRSLFGSGLVATVVATSALALPAPAVAATPAFAPADEATIHPGVMTYTDGAQCTANFIFTSGDDVFIGQAAHCAGTGTATETDGCDSGSLPLGTPVEIEGATRPGVLAYSSWLAMQANGETDENACAYNDLALVRIDPADVDTVNPSVPFFGGPTGLDGNGTTAGENVYSYGNSSLRLGLEPLSPKVGKSLGTSGEGWTHSIYTVTPGIPGDSGSAVLSSDGQALGTLSTVQLAPLAGSNGVSDLAHELAYANEFGGLGTVELELGTEPFEPVP